MNPLPWNSVICFLKNKPWTSSTITAGLHSLKSYESYEFFSALEEYLWLYEAQI